MNQKIERLKQAAAAYYNGASELSDADYDRLYEAAKAEFPDDPFFKTVGAPPSNLFEKVKHAIPMGSLDKVKDVEELRKWLVKHNNPRILVQWKFDGCSLSLQYEEGKLVGAVSRGDGMYGESVLQNVLKSPNIPKVAPGFTGYVRGEALLFLKDFETYFPGGSNPRNVGNGALRNKRGEGCEHLKFKAYDMLCDGETCADTEAGNQRLLEKAGFDVDLGELVETIEQATVVYERRKIERPNLPFEVDGLVLRIDDVPFQKSLGFHDQNPLGVLAWKFPPMGAFSILRSVSWNCGHTGALIPVASIDPVKIGGVMVSSILLNNPDFILEKKIGIGGKIYAVRRGDVIPYAESCEGGTPIVLPTECPVCGGAVARDGAALVCQNEDCDGKAQRKVRRWIRSLDIKNIGPEIETALYETNLAKDPADLYALTREQLIPLQVGNGNLGAKRAQSILDEINKKKELTLAEFLGSLGIRFLGKRSAANFIEATGLKTLEAWRTATVEQINPIGEGMAPVVKQGISDCSDLIDRLLKAGIKITEKKEEEKVSGEGKLTGSYCFTGALPSGMKRTEAQELVRLNGGSVKDSVSADLTYLVIADPDSTSSKAVKARKMGIKLISEEQFKEMLK